MVFLFGEDGSGKSLLMNLSKQILCCDDMNNHAKTLSKAAFLSSISSFHDWDIPTIINSNKLPNYKDESGEVVQSKNTNLENEIKDKEFGVFLHRCRPTFLKFCSRYKNKGVGTFCPVSFIESRNLLRMATNNTYQFIFDRCKYEGGTFTSVPQLNKAMKAYINEKYEMKQAFKDTINITNIMLVDNRYVEKKLNICKSCRKEHKKGCCDKYDRLNRSKSHVILNITLSYGIPDDD
ncbi:uncharacterized protein PITG_16302 [Phytophthora infestans T30-4]|uniref:Uncharacterized protein n=1 Tax=Phytophthora infestans (strain T30-4) TaxID=403677 RepID=D0NTY5_PHYIT|nr:uncharacterized protein PITG_16302 [Phytophthora infestans T30-4]EEY65109.1 conserved hypothetical protein [Phytophthora infestans T30-4]|eukprot:XP_002897366.1 conserved hypothetical protein [Phytophthora infestans T30-4]